MNATTGEAIMAASMGVLDSSADGEALRAFQTSHISTRCPGCERQIDPTKAQILDFFKNRVTEHAAVIECHPQCRDCQTVICLGCGATVDTTIQRPWKSTAIGRVVQWHCDQNRLTSIWLLLSGFDHEARQNKRELPREKTSRPKKKRGQRGTGGIGYSIDRDELAIENEADLLALGFDVTNGTSLDEEAVAMGIAQSYEPSPSLTESNLDDKLTARVLEIVTALLPSTEVQHVTTSFDTNPPPMLSCILRCSSVLDKVAELLRNDSIDDVSRRSGLYSAVLKFVRTLAKGGEATASILQEARFDMGAGHDLLKVSYGEPTVFSPVPINTSPPLWQCMKNLANQSEVLLERTSTNPSEFKDEESQQMILLCNDITSTAELLIVEGTQEEDTDLRKDRNAWQADLRVLAVSDGDILERHAFAKMVREMTGPSAGRIRRITRDIAILTTSLPPGIFVRYGESNLAMKVVITGPGDTPYANGLFEFDLLCPSDYPKKPPKVSFKTTGGGFVNFNPNLYSCGKVCLSLLGTWHGEPWTPSSTLLQLLVSMQAMIFCAHPYTNEPGRDFLAGTDQSKGYNIRLYPLVVKYAMLEWIEGKRSEHNVPQYVPQHTLQQNLLPVPQQAPHEILQPGLQQMLAQAPPSIQTTDINTPVEKSSSSKEDKLWTEVVKKHFDACKDDIVTTLAMWIYEKEEHDRVRELKRPLDTKPKGTGGLPPFSSMMKVASTPGVEEAGLAPEASLKAYLARALEKLKTTYPEYPSFADVFPDEPFVVLKALETL